MRGEHQPCETRAVVRSVSQAGGSLRLQRDGRMGLIKFNQVVSAVLVILIMLIMFQVSLFVPLVTHPGVARVNGQERAMTSNERLVITIVFVLMLIVLGEAARNWASQSFRLDPSKLAASSATIWSTLGRVALLRSLIGLPLLLFMALAANIILGYELVSTIGARRTVLPRPFWMVVGIYLVYALVRRPLARKLKGAMKKGTRGGKVVASIVPTFTVEGESVILDLARKRARPPAERGFFSIASVPCVVKIRFDELDEIRAFSYVEAQSFVQYQMGPDLRIGLEGGQDLRRYLSGEIERPSTYGHWGSVGTTLFLRGPSLFYLITVANTDDVPALQDAFGAFKVSQRAADGAVN